MSLKVRFVCIRINDVFHIVFLFRVFAAYVAFFHFVDFFIWLIITLDERKGKNICTGEGKAGIISIIWERRRRSSRRRRSGGKTSSSDVASFLKSNSQDKSFFITSLFWFRNRVSALYVKDFTFHGFSPGSNFSTFQKSTFFFLPPPFSPLFWEVW